MNWIDELFFCLLLTTISGSVILLLWKLFHKLLMKWNPYIVYFTLRISCFAFVIPIVYLLVRMLYKGNILQISNVDYPFLSWMRFQIPPAVHYVIIGLSIIWLVVIAIMFLRQMKSAGEFKKFMQASVVVTDQHLLDIYERINIEMGIKKSIPLVTNQGTKSPMIAGWIHPKVVLPAEAETKFSDAELELIYLHELTHYKHHDLRYKMLGFFLSAIHFFNPCVHKILKYIGIWGEYNCDAEVIRNNSHRFTAKQYFEMILEMMQGPHGKSPGYTFTALFEDKNSIAERIEHMKEYKKAKSIGKKSAGLIAVAITIFTTSTAYGAGFGIAKTNDKVYKVYEENGVELIEEEAIDHEEEYLSAEEDTCENEIEISEEELNEIILFSTNSLKAFSSVTVPGYTRILMPKCYAESGGTISVTATPDNSAISYRIGIKNVSTGSLRYVTVTGSYGHDFEITASGYYQVFFENMTGTTITLSGSYTY